MEPFVVHTGIVVPIDRRDVDTDAIIPKQFMKSIARTGFGPHLFDALRYLDPGEPGMDAGGRIVNPDFALNQPRYRHASVLLARANFGCGSSREHAPWALAEYGFRALIAPSFADIFRGNCMKNGILPIELPEAIVDRLFAEVHARAGYSLTIDLAAQTVATPEHGVLHFDIEPFSKDRLLDGLDDISLTLRHQEDIRLFEQRHLRSMPWLANRLPG